MFLKPHKVCKDGKVHVYYSLAESVRISRNRTIQRRLFNLGELNTTQPDRWQRSIDVLQGNGQRRQMRLFSDREGQAPKSPSEDYGEVLLSSLQVRKPRGFGGRGWAAGCGRDWSWIGFGSGFCTTARAQAPGPR